MTTRVVTPWPGAIVTIDAAVETMFALRGTLLAEAADPFVEAAMTVLREVCGASLSAGRPGSQRTGVTPADWNAVVAVAGESIAGLVMYSEDERTACRLVSAMTGERVETIDRTAASALEELANMITGRASITLEEHGFPSHISPPQLQEGKGCFIAPRPLTWMTLPLRSGLGQMDVWLALRQA